MKVEIERKIEIFANVLEELAIIREQISERNCLVPGIMNQLNQLVATMELIDTEGDMVTLNHHNDELLNLIGNFRQAIAGLPPVDRATNENVIEQLCARVEALRIKMEQAIEQELLLEKEEDKSKCSVNEATNWHDISEEHSIRQVFSLPSEIDMELDENETAMQVSKGEVVESNVNLPIEEGTATGESGNAEATATANELENNQLIASPSAPLASEAVANAIADSVGFSYHDLVMYNAAVNELIGIQEMPEVAQATHFRDLRNFISRFVQMCTRFKIGVHHIEPMLIAGVIAAFNSETFSMWKAQMIRGRATLRSVREFLAQQEEVASDRWFRESRFVLTKAIKSAQSMVQANKPPGAVLVPMIETKGQPNSTSESMVNGGDQAGCSHWHNQAIANRENSSSRAIMPQVSGNHTPVPEPGSQAQRKGEATAKRDKKKGDKKAKNWICLGCKGNHPLYFCKRYLSLTLRQRLEFVTKHQICPICLVNRHSVMECADRNCGQCDEPHNSTLCEISIGNKQRRERHESDENWEDK